VAARANALAESAKAARAFAEHLAAQIVRTGEAPSIRIEAALLAAMALLDRGRARP
jgi:hypothetical protein